MKTKTVFGRGYETTLGLKADGWHVVSLPGCCNIGNNKEISNYLYHLKQVEFSLGIVNCLYNGFSVTESERKFLSDNTRDEP